MKRNVYKWRAFRTVANLLMSEHPSKFSRRSDCIMLRERKKSTRATGLCKHIKCLCSWQHNQKKTELTHDMVFMGGWLRKSFFSLKRIWSMTSSYNIEQITNKISPEWCEGLTLISYRKYFLQAIVAKACYVVLNYRVCFIFSPPGFWMFLILRKKWLHIEIYCVFIKVGEDHTVVIYVLINKNTELKEAVFSFPHDLCKYTLTAQLSSREHVYPCLLGQTSEQSIMC